MSLSPGSRLGPYEVTAKIGEGGMGEVYRARDTKLGRDVALKVLPDVFADDPERLARFQREARVLASLNHPNIASIYGLEESEGVRALVLELVEGPTLAERIAEGAIAVDEALPIAKQIAEALEAAHEAGVIHRDLKPANVKVKADGMVKVLDFGLAKALQGDAGSDPSESPTLTAAATRAGVIMGTAAYMSPEQARGRQVDKRADVWAFGAVLYEMLTGQRAFVGDDISDTLAAVLRANVDWEVLPEATPGRLRQALMTCLQKDPKHRVRDIADVRLAMEGAFETTVSAPAEPSVSQSPRWRQALPWALAAVMGAALVALLLPRLEPSTPTGATAAHVQVALPLGVYLPVETDHPTLALSPDGSQIVFVGDEDGIRRLYRRDLADPEIHVIEGTEGAASPFFSPDGNWIAFFAGTRLKKVSADSGVPVDISFVTPTTVNRGATWSAEDTFVYSGSANGGLSQAQLVPEQGTQGTDAWTEIAGLPKPSAWPSSLPGGRALLFTDNSSGGLDATRVAAVSLDTGNVTLLVNGGTNPRYSPTGYVLYARSGSLYAVGFDAERGETVGNEYRLLDGVVMGDTGAAQFSVAANGTLAYVAGDVTAVEHELVWVDRTGGHNTLLDNGRRFFDPRLSPDGAQLAIMSPTGTNLDVWVLNLSRGNLTRWTSHPGEDFGPVWHSDGGLAFATEIGEGAGESGPALGWMASSSAPAEQLFKRPGDGVLEFPSSWSPDGQRLAFMASGATGEIDIYVYRADTREAEPLVATPFQEFALVFSPDGSWIAYVSDRTGQEEVYVQPFPGGDEPTQVSTMGGSEPIWSRDGQELFYRESNRLMVVTFGDGPGDPNPPEGLFVDRFERDWATAGRASYDVSLDGSQFVMVRRKNPVTPTVINVVLNWPDVLGVPGQE